MCTSCGNSQCSSCSAGTIPIGPAGADGINGTNGTSATVTAEPAGVNCLYGGVKVVDGAGNITYVCNGAPGASTIVSATNKYANSFTITSFTDPDGEVVINAISIPKSAIIACNALMSTCVSTPTDYDFTVAIWYQSSASQFREISGDSNYISSIKYDTAGNTLVIQPAVVGVFRVVIIG